MTTQTKQKLWEGYPESDFLKVRRSGIGASDIAGICQVGFSTPLKLFCEKTGRTEVEDNAAMRRGRRYEPLILEEFREEFGVGTLIVPGLGNKIIWRHPVYDWAFCHPDGILEDDLSNPIALVQAKFTGMYKGWGTMALGEVPEYIQLQVQWEMFCSGLSLDYVAVLMGNRDFKIYHCHALPEVQKAIFEKAQHFYQEHILKDIMPEPTGDIRDTEALKQLLAISVEKEAPMTAKVVNLINELKPATEVLKIAQVDYDRICNNIKVEMGDSEILNTDRCKVSFKTQERRTFDHKKFIADKEIPADVVEQYNKVSTSRPFKTTWRDNE